MKYFDDNFFLFFEELDLCKRLKSKNKKFYLMNSNKIVHYFHGTSSNLKEINSINHSKLRLWHYHWSSFYYHRKHYGYINSLLVHISKYLRYTLKKYFSILLGNKKNYILHNSQTRGLLSQMLNKKSFFRVELWWSFNYYEVFPKVFKRITPIIIKIIPQTPYMFGIWLYLKIPNKVTTVIVKPPYVA